MQIDHEYHSVLGWCCHVDTNIKEKLLISTEHVIASRREFNVRLIVIMKLLSEYILHTTNKASICLFTDLIITSHISSTSTALCHLINRFGAGLCLISNRREHNR